MDICQVTGSRHITAPCLRETETERESERGREREREREREQREQGDRASYIEKRGP